MPSSWQRPQPAAAVRSQADHSCMPRLEDSVHLSKSSGTRCMIIRCATGGVHLSAPPSAERSPAAINNRPQWVPRAQLLQSPHSAPSRSPAYSCHAAHSTDTCPTARQPATSQPLLACQGGPVIQALNTAARASCAAGWRRRRSFRSFMPPSLPPPGCPPGPRSQPRGPPGPPRRRRCVLSLVGLEKHLHPASLRSRGPA
jgi:hypothetical protein